MTNARKEIRAKYAKARQVREKARAQREFKRNGGIMGAIVRFIAPTWLAL